MKNKLLILMIFFGVLSTQIFVIAQQSKGPLDGIQFVVDSGHGGYDQGASVNEIAEAPLNLEIGKRLEKALENYGANVTMTREDHHDLAEKNSTNRKKEDIKKRIAIINQETNDFFISIHMNKYSTSQPKGAQVFYQNNDLINETLAQSVQFYLNQLTKENKNIKKGDFLLLNESKKPGILVECGFLSNDVDRSLLQQTTYQTQLVDAIVKGVVKVIETFNL